MEPTQDFVTATESTQDSVTSAGDTTHDFVTATEFLPNSAFRIASTPDKNLLHNAIQGALPEKNITPHEKLNSFFPPKQTFDSRYSDSEILEIAGLLQDSWKPHPRLYIVLRLVGKLEHMDNIIRDGHSDIWFPFPPEQVPIILSPGANRRFLTAQEMIITADPCLEDGKKGKHCHLPAGELMMSCFQTKRILGSGGFGQVEKVISRSTMNEYALKRIRRDKLAEKGEKYFLNELEALRTVDHRHIVKLVGSFTDPTYVGFIMSPVADCDFATFLSRAEHFEDNKSWLWSYFGCLANALFYLHFTSSIRHKDIKPSNILVREYSVLLTDFGLAYNWSKSQRTTTAEEKYWTEKYCAPEAVMDKERHSSSDIWSLGCVFLEMVTVLRGESLNTMQTFLSTNGSKQSNYRHNLDGISQWIRRLKDNSRSELESRPLDWIMEMLKHDHEQRPNARQLMESIWKSKSQNDFLANSSKTFYGICCERSVVFTTIEMKGLHTAAGYGDEMEVIRLLNMGANPNWKDSAGQTVLHLATEEGKISLVQALLKHGRNVNIEERDSKGRTALYLASQLGNKEVAEILLKKGADVSAKESDFGYTPMHAAAWYGNEGVVRLLLQQADLNSKSNAGHTPLSLAQLWNRESIIALLKDATKSGTEVQEIGNTEDSTKSSTEVEEIGKTESAIEGISKGKKDEEVKAINATVTPPKVGKEVNGETAKYPKEDVSKKRPNRLQSVLKRMLPGR